MFRLLILGFVVFTYSFSTTAFAQNLEIVSEYSVAGKRQYQFVKTTLNNLITLVNLSNTDIDYKLKSYGYDFNTKDYSTGHFLDTGEYIITKDNPRALSMSYFSAVNRAEKKYILNELKDELAPYFNHQDENAVWYQLVRNGVVYRIAIATLDGSQMVSIFKPFMK